MLCVFLGTKHLMANGLQPADELTSKTFNKNIVITLQQYTADHRTDWEIYLQLLTYAYIAQEYRSTN